MVAGNKHHRAIMSCHCFEKHPGAVIQCEDLKGLEVAPSAGGDAFRKTMGKELLLGLPSEALTKRTVRTLCSSMRVARKDGVHGHLQAKIALNPRDAPNAKVSLNGILKHSPNMNRKRHVSRLLFLARLLAACRMETCHVSEGDKSRCVVFEEDAGDEKGLKLTVASSLNALKMMCGELENKDDSKKRHRKETPIDNSIGTHALHV
jgi:hypothetical protein